MGMIPMSIPGAIGTNAGADSDGVLIGQMTATDPSKALLKSHAVACLCITDDGGLYVNETTEANEGTADDVEIVGTTLATGDAIYVGHATLTAAQIDFSITTQGDYTTTTFTRKYWNGTAWTALSSVVDGTNEFEAATGVKILTYDLPGDWVKCLVDGVNAYWIQIECDATVASVTPCQIGQIWWVVASADATWTDDTTDFTDAGTGDVELLPLHPVVGDGFYFQHATEKFCKLKVVYSQKRTGTATFVFKYWNGATYEAIPIYDDDSNAWSANVGTLVIHFDPPSNWAINTESDGPNSEAGYTVVMEMTAITTVTAQPLGTQAWVFPLITGASGINSPNSGTSVHVTMSAQTKSGTNNDTTLLLVNCTQGVSASVVWTKADPHVEADVTISVLTDDEIALVQITEDASTEFADVNIVMNIT